MKLGYFTHTDVSPSETFIFDLIQNLNNEKNIDLTVYGGKKQHRIKGIKNLKVVSTGFAQKGLATSFKLYKIGQIFGGNGYKYKNQYQQWRSRISLRTSIRTDALPDIAYIEYGTSAVLCYKFLLENKVPYIVHIHGYDVTSATNDPVYKGELINSLNQAKIIIAPSRHLKRYLILLGCVPTKIQVIYPVTDLSTITPKKASKSENNQTLIFLGRLTAKKNPFALLHAFSIVSKAVPNSTLKILGDGELRAETELLIKQLGLEAKVNMLGSVDKKTAFENLSQADIYVQHSVTSSHGDQEGFPVSLAEAAAHALPIVSTIHSGITENVINGVTGFLVQEYDYENMAEKIIYLLQHPNIATEMGAEGRRRIMKLCESNARAESIKNICLACH